MSDDQKPKYAYTFSGSFGVYNPQTGDVTPLPLPDGAMRVQLHGEPVVYSADVLSFQWQFASVETDKARAIKEFFPSLETLHYRVMLVPRSVHARWCLQGTRRPTSIVDWNAVGYYGDVNVNFNDGALK